MKKYNQAKAHSFVRRFPRLVGTGILLTVAFLTIGVVAGITKQKSRAPESVKGVAGLMPNHMEAEPAGNRQINQASQVKPMSAEEAEQRAAALKELANQSTAGLKKVKQPDGTVSMDLQGHFQNVAVARRNEDGSISQSCIDNPVAGAAFFGIDPKLVGAKTGALSNTSPSNK